MPNNNPTGKNWRMVNGKKVFAGPPKMYFPVNKAMHTKGYTSWLHCDITYQEGGADD